MPPIIKWKCTICGKTRILGPDVTLVLCSTIGCQLKQLKRIGHINSIKKDAVEVQRKL